MAARDAKQVEADALAAVEAALATAKVVVVDDVRKLVAELHIAIDGLGASDFLTAAKDRLTDALQFVHAHDEAK